MSFRTVPVKAVATLNPETLSEDTDSDRIFSYAEISDVSVGQPVRWQEPSPFGSLPSRARRVVRDGDVIISTVRTYLRAVAHVVDAPATAVVSTGFAVFRPARIDARFLGYALEETHFVDRVVAASVGVSYPAVNASDIARLPISAPSPDIQRQIADYLDHETAEIDAFIADLGTLATLTRERFDSRLSAEMTGPYPRVNIRRVAEMRTGHTPSRAVTEYWTDTNIPWFTLADVWQLRQGRKYLGDTKEQISELGVSNSAAEVLPAGTVVLSRTASVGFTGIMPRPMATSQDYWNWVCGPRLNPEYLWNQFRAMKPTFDRLKSGSTHKTIYQADAAALTVVVPSIGDQAEIVERIARAEATVTAEIADIDAAIALAKERRAALITAAVTGQIDVTTKGSREHADL